eukprot:3787182-Amphidinium_carterae.1
MCIRDRFLSCSCLAILRGCSGDAFGKQATLYMVQSDMRLSRPSRGSECLAAAIRTGTPGDSHRSITRLNGSLTRTCSGRTLSTLGGAE